MNKLAFGALMAALLPCSAMAQQQAYPAQGQSPGKQRSDEAQCSSWARSKSGYDPANPPAVAQAQPAPVTGSGARARGAARGALIGGIAGGDAGSGAVAGAAMGGVRQRVRNAQAADAQRDASAQYAADMQGSYLRARAACLSARGYTVR